MQAHASPAARRCGPRVSRLVIFACMRPSSGDWNHPPSHQTHSHPRLAHACSPHTLSPSCRFTEDECQVFLDREGNVVMPMCADYGFRSGAGRLYMDRYGETPGSVWDLVRGWMGARGGSMCQEGLGG